MFYRIAGLTAEVNCNSALFIRRAMPYRVDTQHDVDISITADDVHSEQMYVKNPEMQVDECRYFLYGKHFYEQLLDYDGMLLHASAVEVDGKAYLFSAKSGTGKSTHTQLWRQLLGDRAIILNDDKPAIRLIGKQFYCFGTPWSGTSDLNCNRSALLGGIVFLERASQNRIERIEGCEAVKYLLQQTIRPQDPRRATSLLKLADNLLTNVPTYRMWCNQNPEAARIAYQNLSGRNL